MYNAVKILSPRCRKRLPGDANLPRNWLSLLRGNCSLKQGIEVCRDEAVSVVEIHREAKQSVVPAEIRTLHWSEEALDSLIHFFWVNKPSSYAPENFFVSIALECDLFPRIHFKAKAVERLLDQVLKTGQLRKANTSAA
jgi:hypothetical protein